MSHRISFQSFRSESTFLHPRMRFEETRERFEVRLDPLTGRTCHFSHIGAIKPQRVDPATYLKEDVKGFCPFCPENLERTTPKFVAQLYPEERPVRGEAVLIPNLFPYDKYSAVLIMAREHVVPLEGFTRERLRNALSLGVDFLKRIRSLDPSLPYHLMSWNYMPPSGGGLVHPHQQYFATDLPGNQYADELAASKRFFEQHGESYWKALVDEEKEKNERYVGGIGDSHWISSFTSLGVLGEVICIFPGVFSIDRFQRRHEEDLVEGLLRVFQYYNAAGIQSFNAAFFFGPENQEYFSAHLRIIPRTFLNVRDFAPDLNFFQALLSEPVSVIMPEDLCKELRGYF
jgi:UDPglucose--hexose-1-phosphate uridylyltransferase